MGFGSGGGRPAAHEQDRPGSDERRRQQDQDQNQRRRDEHHRTHHGPRESDHPPRIPREPWRKRTTTTTRIAPSVAMKMLSILMPSTVPILKTLVARNPPTSPPTMPRMTIITSPSRE